VRGINAAAALLLALVLGVVAGALGAPAFAVLGPLFVGVCAVWPAAGVVALIVACALDRLAVSVGGPNVRPDELAALALAAALVIRAVLTPRTAPTPRRHGPARPAAPRAGQTTGPATAVAWQTTGTAVPADYGIAPQHVHTSGLAFGTPDRSRSRFAVRPRGLVSRASPDSPTGQSQAARAAPGRGVGGIPLLLPLLAYLGANALSTLSSGEGARGLSLDLITLALAILYGALVVSLDTPGRLLFGVRLWLGVAAAEAIIGMLAFALYLGVHAAVPGVQLDPNSNNAPLVYGTLYEGNIFGSYMSAAFLIALALVAEETVRRKGLLYLVLAATAVGLLVSGTRSAWGATIVGAVVLLALSRLGRGGRRGRLLVRLVGGLVAVGLIVVIGLIVLPSSVTGAFGARAQGLLNFGSGSGYGRVLLYREAVAEWQTQPLLGLGPGSFAYKLSGDTSTSAAWLPNLTLLTLHDTGALGLLALVWLFAAFYAMATGALRRAPPGETRAALAGLTAAVTALLVAFQLTPGLNLGYSWALLALGVAAARAAVGAREGRSVREERTAA